MSIEAVWKSGECSIIWNAPKLRRYLASVDPQ